MSSTFNIFKIGIGPSSSHTVGPMYAAKAFVDELIEKDLIPKVTRMQSDIYGSLSLTGRGHHTDIAIMLGLAGNRPDNVDIESIPDFIEQVKKTHRLPIYSGKYEVEFSYDDAMIFNFNFLEAHENGMILTAFDEQDKVVLQETYYSIGGGKIVKEENIGKAEKEEFDLPYPFETAEELLAHCEYHSLSISSIILKNELAIHTKDEIDDYYARVYSVMLEGIDRGIHTEGLLPGPLRVSRRANALYRQLSSDMETSKAVDPMILMDWINLYAFAVNEENAAGGRVVTAPTNGACGVIPAVLAYYNRFVKPISPDAYLRYFLTCAAIGQLYQKNASISGAEVGCQGEVGVACSMAAAGLTEILGGSPMQVCMAAEIAMEHNLGLTCDPVAGQVQVPCIERNAIAAVKAINSSRMAIRRTTPAKISLDKVIQTMYETGKDMNAKYRETSQGGLAINIRCQ